MTELYLVTIRAASTDVARQNFILQKGGFVNEHGPQRECTVTLPCLFGSSTFFTHFLFDDPEEKEEFPTTCYSNCDFSELEKIAEKIRDTNGLTTEVSSNLFMWQLDRLRLIAGETKVSLSSR